MNLKEAYNKYTYMFENLTAAAATDRGNEEVADVTNLVDYADKIKEVCKKLYEVVPETDETRLEEMGSLGLSFRRVEKTHYSKLFEVSAESLFKEDNYYGRVERKMSSYATFLDTRSVNRNCCVISWTNGEEIAARGRNEKASYQMINDMKHQRVKLIVEYVDWFPETNCCYVLFRFLEPTQAITPKRDKDGRYKKINLWSWFGNGGVGGTISIEKLSPLVQKEIYIWLKGVVLPSVTDEP